MGLFGKKQKQTPPMQAGPPPVHQAIAEGNADTEIAAAIAVALRLYSYKALEFEETIITIQKVIRPYSPWNSKIYNMKQMPPRISTRPPQHYPSQKK